MENHIKKSNKKFWCILIIILLIIISYISIQLYMGWLREQTKEESIRITEKFFEAIHTQDISMLDEIMSDDTVLKHLYIATYAEARDEIAQKWENADFTAEGGEIIMSLSWFYESQATILVDNIMVKGEFGESDMSCVIWVVHADSGNYRIEKIDVRGDDNMLEQVWYTGN